jgi:hypothetical protein
VFVENSGTKEKTVGSEKRFSSVSLSGASVFPVEDRPDPSGKRSAGRGLCSF